ncbi:MAG TPA: hypothetical protein VKV95_02700 [Terriglobia bacterium]|nr:hypothetical protein [Terriglobia bacterium]
MFRSPAKRVWTGFALISVATLARAQKPTAIPLVPAADWSVLSTSKADLNTIRQFGGEPAVEREYGVVSVQIRNCRLGGRTLSVLVEPSPDPSSAYGLLTFYRTETMAPVAGLPFAFLGSDGALLAHGRNFFRVPRVTGAGFSDNDLSALLFILGNSRLQGEKPLVLPAALPQPGLVPGSEKYLLGEEAARRALPGFRTDLLGFSLGAEVQSGMYSTGTGRATVLAINYPTPQISRAKFGELEKTLGLNQDRGGESTYGKRLGSFVIVVLNAGTPAIGKGLVDMFAFSGQITQNEPYLGDKPVVVQMAELIVANIIFVLILAGIAIGSGFIFYLSREFAKKWLPKTQWGAQDEATIITLKLS